MAIFVQQICLLHCVINSSRPGHSFFFIIIYLFVAWVAKTISTAGKNLKLLKWQSLKVTLVKIGKCTCSSVKMANFKRQLFAYCDTNGCGFVQSMV